MDQPKDGVRNTTSSHGDYYYSQGDYLREKHRLAGDNFVTWSLDRLPVWTSATILDAGAGWGRYVWQLLDNYGVDASDIVLNDLSVGMLKTAREEAKKRGIHIVVTAHSIEHIPFPDSHFDIVMANKVLYHLDDIPGGIGELARVLKPDGHMLSTTNSDSITATVVELHHQALERLGLPYMPEPSSPFSMENGYELLLRHFRRVEVHYYEDEVLFHSAAAMRKVYETIGRYRNTLCQHEVAKALPNIVEKLAQDIIDRDGVLPSPVRMGAFICREPS